MSGYLDEVLCIFREHDHPFVVVGRHAMRWHAIEDPGCGDIIEILVSPQKKLPIAQSLVETGHWILSPPARPQFPQRVHPNSFQGTWLRHASGAFGPDGQFEHLQFRSEKPYFVPISSCLEFEVPDFSPRAPLTLEEEYIRDPHRRFGPDTWEMFDERALDGSEDEFEEDFRDDFEAGVEDDFEDEFEFRLPERKIWDSDTHPALHKKLMARSPSVKVPIFIPSISAHVNALLQQAQYKVLSGTVEDTDALHRLDVYVTDLTLEWAPTARWFLDTKVTESNRKFMEELLRSFHRDGWFLYNGKQPWELRILPKLETQCDERCGYCQGEEEKQCKSELVRAKL